MAKIFIDLTEDERWLNGHIPVHVTDKDNLSGTHSAVQIGEEIEMVLTVRQCITLFDVLDGWLNGGPCRTIGGIEKRITEVISETVKEDGQAVRAMGTRPEELAHVIYENMKLRGLRFRLTDQE